MSKAKHNNSSNNSNKTTNNNNSSSSSSSNMTNNSAVRQTPITCPGHTRPVVFLAFSDVTPTGYYSISACKDGKPMLRQGETGDWIGTFEGHKGAIWGCALNSDATKAASAAADFQAIIWDALSGEQLYALPHKHIVKTVDFSTDSVHLVSGSNEKLLRIFDLNAVNSDPLVLSGHTGPIKQAIYLNGNRWIASIAEDKTLRIWDAKSAAELKKIDLPDNPTSIEISRDDEMITLTYGNKVTFWNAATLEKLREYKVPTDVYSASISKDKTIFACGGLDFKVYKYDFQTGEELDSFKGHFGPVHCVRFSPDGELYASGSEDGTLRLWQTNVGKKYGLWTGGKN